jgi:hypothetical protein
MRSFRRRLASCALAVVLLQCALLFAAPVSACCGTAAARAHATQAEDSPSIECCPAGAHAPGQCPLHKKERSSDCAVRCGQTHAPDFVLGAVGILTPPVLSLAPPATMHVGAIAIPGVVVRAIPPDGPPPRSL